MAIFYSVICNAFIKMYNSLYHDGYHKISTYLLYLFVVCVVVLMAVMKSSY